MKPSVKTILWSLVAGVGVAVLGAVGAAALLIAGLFALL